MSKNLIIDYALIRLILDPDLDLYENNKINISPPEFLLFPLLIFLLIMIKIIIQF